MAGDATFFQEWFRRGPLRAGHGISSSTEGISELRAPCFINKALAGPVFEASTCLSSTVCPPHHPKKKGPIHKSPSNQFMTPTRARDLLWIRPPSLGKTEKSTVEEGSL